MVFLSPLRGRGRAANGNGHVEKTQCSTSQGRLVPLTKWGAFNSHILQPQQLRGEGALIGLYYSIRQLCRLEFSNG